MPAPASIQERTARITANVLRRCDLTLLLLDAKTGKHMPAAAHALLLCHTCMS